MILISINFLELFFKKKPLKIFGYQIEYQLYKIIIILNKLKDKSIERVLKSFIEEKSLIKLLKILEEENMRNENIKIENRRRKLIYKNISNRFYN